MRPETPQNNSFVISKGLASLQCFFNTLTPIIAIYQAIKGCIPHTVFLYLTSLLLVLDFVLSYGRDYYFDEGHQLTTLGLFDNSFNEKRLPNYDSEPYYNNSSINTMEIKLLANIHENALFTSHITKKMTTKYFVLSGIVFLSFLSNVFLNGMDDYSSIVLGFLLSGSILDRGLQINNLKKRSEEVYKSANELCNDYEKQILIKESFLSKVLLLLLKYENTVFESKIILSKRIFSKLNNDISEEWNIIKNKYSIYTNTHF